MTKLDNPADSPCWGCGPGHPRGLHLEFERVKALDGVDEVRTTYAPNEDEIGWPGLFHTGLHFLVVYETCYWASLELGGGISIPDGPALWEQVRLPRTGRPFIAKARILSQDGDKMRVRSTSVTPDGRTCATLEQGMRRASWQEAEKWGVHLRSTFAKR